MTPADLKRILAEHGKWLRSQGGARADLRGADLCGANLRGANLRGANLRGADLRDADLCGANLRDANLRGADLRDANLCGADLRGADLRDANLCGADLCGADLRDANLCGADLCGAEGFDPADYLPAFWIVPQVGAFTAWKKLQDGIIAQVEIPVDSRRTSSIKSRKCRAEYVRVRALFGADGQPYSGAGKSIHDPTVEYVIGAEVRADSYDDSMLKDCSNGIHFFITREEAEIYE